MPKRSRKSTVSPGRKAKPGRGAAPPGRASSLSRFASQKSKRPGSPVRTAADTENLQSASFRRFFENASEGMFRTTPEGRYLEVNPALARMYGYSSPREMMESVRDIAQNIYVDPSRRDDFKRLIERNDVVRGFESLIRRKDGVHIWLSENAVAVRDKQGFITAYEGTIEDVSERKRSDLEREVATEIVRSVSITENLDDLLQSIHVALKRVLFAGNCFIALYDDVSQSFQFPFFVDRGNNPPQPDMTHSGCAAQVYRSGRPILIPSNGYENLVRSGRAQAVPPAPSWLGVPLRAPSVTIGVLVVQHHEKSGVYSQRDMEFLVAVGDQIAFAIERKRAEIKMHESEARLRVLIEQLPAVLLTFDADLRFTSAMGTGLARLRLKPDQVIGTLLIDYFETTDQTFLPVAAHRRAVNGESVTYHLEWKDASFACHVEPLRNSEGQIVGAISMALDITDRKQLEEQFRQAQKMEAVGRLAGGIAHDFNNLLMVIQGYSDLLADRLPEGDPLRRDAEQIQMAAQRATSLTQQLLAFSRKQILAPKVLNIQTVVSDMDQILRRLIGEDIDLETSWANDLWLVKADRSQIEQVIMNLAVNARDAMPKGGRLTIETHNVELDAAFSNKPTVLLPGKYVMLAVTDNGCGMDALTQAHIFEPFFTTKEKGKGTGLGLAMVYGIVKQSGGYVWVYSEPNRGTTFKIYLPKIEDATLALALDRDDSKSLPRGTEMVLLVEDERGVRELAREYLQTCGYGVLEASDGQNALDLTSTYNGHIHLLMTDVVMPGMSGRDLAERIIQSRPGIKILYMSGYTDQSVIRHGILDHEAGLLQKPFTLATLAAKLRQILAPQPMA